MTHNYFSTNTQTLIDPNWEEVSQMYDKGYVLTRLGKSVFNQTRSLRICLDDFELTSENRRVLRKNENLKVEVLQLPLTDYSWQIHKMGKEFYTTKFGDNVMSASKIKEMFNDMTKSNMNFVFRYFHNKNASENLGYTLSYINSELVHYAYPFYDLTVPRENSLGLGMMLLAILWAKENGKKYIYLGSVTTPESKYKLQFEGLEWFDTEKKEWSREMGKLKELINSH